VSISASILSLHKQLSVSASIQSLHTQVFLYQQVSTDTTAICICISKYPESPHPSFSVSAIIHRPNPPLYLYKPVSRAPNLIAFVSAGISSLHVQHARGARPEQRPTPVSVRGRTSPDDREQECQRVLLQQLSGAVPLGAHGQAVPVRSVLLPHRWVAFRGPEGQHHNQILLWNWSLPKVLGLCDVTFGVTCQKT
jgi:hypothetical protein